MKHLVAYTGTRSGGLHKVLSTQSSIFEEQDLTSAVEYAASYKLEEDEWFYIDNFSTRNYSNDFIEKSSPLSTTGLNQLEVNNFKKIKYLCYEEGEVKFFQKVLPSSIINKKWFTVANAPVFENNKKIISIAHSPDAIYHMTDDKLFFKDIARVKAIFKGIDELYREATQTEVNDFLQQEFIELKDDYKVEDVKVPNRKRIALAIDRLAHFNDEEKGQVFNYIHEYCPSVDYTDGKFAIGNEDDLKFVLFGIDERYYTTSLGQEKRLANSVIAM